MRRQRSVLRASSERHSERAHDQIRTVWLLFPAPRAQSRLWWEASKKPDPCVQRARFLVNNQAPFYKKTILSSLWHRHAWYRVTGFASGFVIFVRLICLCACIKTKLPPLSILKQQSRLQARASVAVLLWTRTATTLTRCRCHHEARRRHRVCTPSLVRNYCATSVHTCDSQVSELDIISRAFIHHTFPPHSRNGQPTSKRTFSALHFQPAR